MALNNLRSPGGIVLCRVFTRPYATVRHIQLPTSQSVDAPQSSALQPIDVLERYRGLVDLGKIKYDENQVRVVMQLRRLYQELKDYAPPALATRYTRSYANNTQTPWWAREQDEQASADASLKALVRVKNHAEDLADLTTPKGLLLIGPPGSGKSFLVDLWYSTVPTPYKARKHYNELVLELYRGVWEETKYRMTQTPSVVSSSQPWTRAMRDTWHELLSSRSLPSKWTRSKDMKFPPSQYSAQPTIAFVVARRLLLRHWLLVFDEVQLLDVSSATLLADVLSWYWRMGGIIVATSNKVPDDLYKNGVQRDRLEPFVEALKVRCPIVELQVKRDWREVRASSSADRTWYTGQSENDFIRYLPSIIGDVSEPSALKLNVFGRTVVVPWAIDGVCKFTFKQLCDESLGPADYLTLTSTFHTFVITSVPILRLSNKDQARRFISLIDALYETRCRLVCHAECSPETLFFPDDVESSSRMKAVDELDVLLAEAVGETRDVYRPNVSSYDAPNMAELSDATSRSPGYEALETLSIFSGKDEQFAYKRALSRLLEMTSESYTREEKWKPLPDAARKWEKATNSTSTVVINAASPTRDRMQEQGCDEDFAEEAAFEGSCNGTGRRPDAPRLREDHIWGVRDDWGEGVGAWGRRTGSR